MRKSDLTEALIGRKCVVYDPTYGRCICTIARIYAENDLVVFDIKDAVSQQHYKNVHLLKKKYPKCYWISKTGLMLAGGFIKIDPRDQENYIKVKVVK